MPSFGLAHPRARFPFERLTATALARVARTPSYRAPRAADLHNPDTFPPPSDPAAGESLTGRAFISAGAGLTRVRLVAVQPFMGELAACPYLATLRRLDLTGNRVGPAGAAALAASVYLGGLRELGLSGNALGADGAAALGSAAWLAQLEELELADNRLSAPDLFRLLAPATGLVTLDVSGNPLGPAATVPGLPDLRHLKAARCELGADGAATLLAGADGLESLDLRHNRVGNGLPRLGLFDTLVRLDLGFNDLAGTAMLDAFPRVRALGLRANRLSAAAVQSLARFQSVESLDVSVNPLGDDGAAMLLRAFPNLTRLDLGNTGLGDAGVRRLVASGALGGLRSLSLAWNPVGDDAAAALAGLTHLEVLDLAGTQLGLRGAKTLAESPDLGQLRTVALGENHRLPPPGLGLLWERFGRISATDRP